MKTVRSREATCSVRPWNTLLHEERLPRLLLFLLLQPCIPLGFWCPLHFCPNSRGAAGTGTARIIRVCWYWRGCWLWGRCCWGRCCWGCVAFGVTRIRVGVGAFGVVAFGLVAFGVANIRGGVVAFGAVAFPSWRQPFFGVQLFIRLDVRGHRWSRKHLGFQHLWRRRLKEARVPLGMVLLAREEDAVDAPVLGHVECVLLLCIGWPRHTDSFGALDRPHPVEAAQTLPSPKLMCSRFGFHTSKTVRPPFCGELVHCL